MCWTTHGRRISSQPRSHSPSGISLAVIFFSFSYLRHYSLTSLQTYVIVKSQRILTTTCTVSVLGHRKLCYASGSSLPGTCFVWQEVCDQAALSGVWHSGLHDTGQDCKAATSAGLDHSPGTCKEGMPCMQEFTQGITCYAGCLIFNIVFSSDHLCSISAVSTVEKK